MAQPELLVPETRYDALVGYAYKDRGQSVVGSLLVSSRTDTPTMTQLTQLVRTATGLDERVDVVIVSICPQSPAQMEALRR